ncbi:MAG: substrate-binding domain-containing protein [Rhodospirillaceae bacterium]|nr:substrate-binding domain-containing protein [Rhodospirillaceae bacterium]
MALPALSRRALAEGEGKEYVFLSCVTQVPFWVDHRKALEDVGKALGVKTSFTGPLDFDTAAQARQLDELIARKPAGILVFPGDADAMRPGVQRATEAGIPVATIIGDIPDSGRYVNLGISSYEAGRVGGEMLAKAIGGKGKVLMGTFPAPSVLERVEGYKALFKEKYPEIEVVEVVNDKADPSYAPTAYAQALQAHPDVVGIGGTDGDSGKGAAIAVREAGLKGKVKIVAMDRNDDMLPFIEDGTIEGSVAQKSYAEAYVAVYLLHWLNTDAMKVVPDWRSAKINPLPEKVVTGVMPITRDNVAQFKHA